MFVAVTTSTSGPFGKPGVETLPFPDIYEFPISLPPTREYTDELKFVAPAPFSEKNEKTESPPEMMPEGAGEPVV